ncbi:Holliday junction branch migration protein RuvA [Candidatus Parcubacteria bacterium]|nr:Holliday junction branch migration protein RuvA [Candidatus Parcubacteria bacterium]
MIAYLQGKIILKKDLKRERFVVMNVGGKGYKVFLSKKVFTSPAIALAKAGDESESNESIELFCYLYVRENIMDLYGFLSWEEREVFEMLIGISGVGPKAALEISGLGPLENLKKSIEAGDGKIFEGIPGIGRKRAGKILLELSGKIRDFGAPARPHTNGIGVGGRANDGAEEDPCVDALVNMGFSKTQVIQTLAQIPKEEISEEERIKQALKILR